MFVGDAGTTEAGRPSHRYGVEWANYYAPRPWLTLDADVASPARTSRTTTRRAPRSRARCRPCCRPAPRSTTCTGSSAVSGWRYFGPRPLVEDGSVRSKATSLANLQVGYRFTPSCGWRWTSSTSSTPRDSDIDYYYTSRLPGEPVEGVDDLHFHPALPRTARLALIIGY